MASPTRSEPFSDLFKGRVIAGAATAEGTRAYFEAMAPAQPTFLPEYWTTTVAGMDWQVSRLAMGTYRIERGNRKHYDAVREALITGTNVIDTAANYVDGQAESVVGNVVEELIRAGRLKREGIVIISKAGYIQKQNLIVFERHRQRYDEAIEVRPDLWHCIQPAFLEDQANLSRRRLGLKRIDVFLVHNPEYHLAQYAQMRLPRDEANDRFYAQLRESFAALERLVERGTIGCYGISSNTLALPAEAPDAVDLSRIQEVAGPGFRVVQFPGNLIENDFRYSHRSPGGNLAEQLEQSNLWSMAHRPLNALYALQSHGNSNHLTGLLRLARMPSPPPDDGAMVRAEFQRVFDELEEAEENVLDVFSEKHFSFDVRTPSPVALMREYRDHFVHREDFANYLELISKELGRTFRLLHVLTEERNQRYAVQSLIRRTNHAVAMWERYIDVNYHARMELLETRLGQVSTALGDQPLARQALLFLLDQTTPMTVLLGMRRVEYVRQAHAVYGLPRPLPEEGLHILDAAEDALTELARGGEAPG